MEPLGTPLSDEAAEAIIGAAARAQLYRERAAALEAQLAGTELPRLQERLRFAAERFRELATSEDVLARRKVRMVRENLHERSTAGEDRSLTA